VEEEEELEEEEEKVLEKDWLMPAFSPCVD